LLREKVFFVYPDNFLGAKPRSPDGASIQHSQNVIFKLANKKNAEQRVPEQNGRSFASCNAETAYRHRIFGMKDQLRILLKKHPEPARVPESQARTRAKADFGQIFLRNQVRPVSGGVLTLRPPRSDCFDLFCSDTTPDPRTSASPHAFAVYILQR
jgi:hypothetical protein